MDRGSHQRSFEPYQLTPTPLRPPLPQDWRFSAPKIQLLLSHVEKGKATNFKFGCYIQRVHQNKSSFQILDKRERGRILGLPKFFEYPLLSQERVKLRTLYAHS